MRLSEKQRAEIRLQIRNGANLNDLAELYDVDKRTIQRIKKEMPADDLGDHTAGCFDDFIQVHSTTYLTKKEELYAKAIKNNIWLYEDPDEGWLYHLDRSDYRLKTSGRWWIGIAYPESVLTDWLARLERLGFEIAISPLHDKDTWDHDSPAYLDPETGEIIAKGARYKVGDPKKPHWHFIIKCEKQMSAVEINRVIRAITRGPYLQKCYSIRSYYKYFLHKTEKSATKYQGYLKEDIIHLNGFSIEPNKQEQGQMSNDIIRTIKEHEFDNWADFMEFYIDQIEYIALITAKPYSFATLIKSYWLKHNPHGHVQQVYIVDTMEVKKHGYKEKRR